MTSGYWQVALAEEDRHKTAFVTSDGLYQFKVLPFGLKNAPSGFQRMMDSILSAYKWKCCLVYLDDIIIFSNDFESHLKHLTSVMSTLQQRKIRLNGKKCKIAFTSIDFLGHIVSAEGIKPDPRNVEAIAKFEVPNSVTKVRSFLGLASYYRRFIPQFSQIANPLNDLLKKDCKFEWTQACTDAYLNLKSRLTSSPIVSHFRDNCETQLETDASKQGIGGVISQLQDGKWRMISCASRTLTPAEKNYQIMEMEALGLVWCVNRFRPYLHGRHFTLKTDNHSCCYLMSIKKPSPKIARWLQILAEYEFDIKHTKGTDNCVADHLSRWPMPRNAKLEEEDFPIFMIKANEIKEAQEEDEWLQAERIRPNHPKFIFGVMHPHDLHIILVSEDGTRIPKIVIPEKLKTRVLSLFHDDQLHGGHFGTSRTTNAIKQRFYWKGMDKDIDQYVSTCEVCQFRNSRSHKRIGELQTAAPRGIFECYATDVIGPLPQTKSKKRFIITLIDLFSKWCEAIAVHDQVSAKVIDFLDETFLRFGFPARLVHDRGPNFMSKEFQDYLTSRGIKSCKTSGYRPQSNGNVERMNRTLIVTLSKYANDNRTNWDVNLKKALSCYNRTVQSSTKRSPYEIIFATKPALPIDNMLGLRINPGREREAREQFARSIRFSVVDEIKKSHEESKRRYDEKVKKVDIRPGDEVLIAPTELHQKIHKLNPKQYTGPFKVLEMTSPVNLKLKSTENVHDKPFIIHVDRCKKFKRRTLVPIVEEPVGSEDGSSTESPPNIGNYWTLRRGDDILVRGGDDFPPEEDTSSDDDSFGSAENTSEQTTEAELSEQSGQEQEGNENETVQNENETVQNETVPAIRQDVTVHDRSGTQNVSVRVLNPERVEPVAETLRTELIAENLPPMPELKLIPTEKITPTVTTASNTTWNINQAISAVAGNLFGSRPAIPAQFNPSNVPTRHPSRNELAPIPSSSTTSVKTASTAMRPSASSSQLRTIPKQSVPPAKNTTRPLSNTETMTQAPSKTKSKSTSNLPSVDDLEPRRSNRQRKEPDRFITEF